MELSHWLKQHGLSAEAYHAEALLDQFLKEMQRGLDGKSSSLAMIRCARCGNRCRRNQP